MIVEYKIFEKNFVLMVLTFDKTCLNIGFIVMIKRSESKCQIRQYFSLEMGHVNKK